MKSIRIVSISCVVAGLAASAVAQNALDNNLQVGSGGRNSTVATPDFASRNLLVTDNVPGGIGFQSDVIDGAGNLTDGLGYLSPGGFSGSLASDELFRFRARTMSVGNLNTAQPAYVDMSPPAVFRGGGAISVGDVTDGQSAVGPFFQIRDPGHASTASYQPALPTLTTVGTSYVSVYDMEHEGRKFRMRADSLRGFRSMPLDPVGQQRDAPPADPRLEIEPTPDSEADEPAESKDDGPMLSHGLWAPSLVIGEQLLAAVDSNQVDSNEVDQSVEKLEKALVQTDETEDGTEEQDEDEVFNDLLKKLQERQRKLLMGKPLDDGADEEGDGDDGDASKDTGTEDEPRDPEAGLMTGFKFESPGAAQMRAAAEKRKLVMQRFLRRATGKDPDAQDGESELDLDGPLPKRLNRLMSTLDYDMPSMKSMAGAKETRINELIRRAEGHMAEGRYFLAQRTYRKVLDYKQTHAMGRAGLVHAQLGAGMIRSSAFHLRKLFAAYPQLIATRYEPALLPAANRMEFIKGQIERMIEASEKSDGPLVLAYLGYQTRAPDVVRYALDLAQARRPDDRLLPLLRKIWLDGDEKAGESAAE